MSTDSPLTGKIILLGVTGSIAAYKAADICSQLTKLGADIHVILTKVATKFIGEATLRALTRNPVITDLFDEPSAKRIAHIDLAQSADLVLVAPATADIIGRMAHGLADDMLSTCLLATPPHIPILVAPAMNTVMWEHPATRMNIRQLIERGVHLVPPGYGLLACLDIGTGKLATVETIVSKVQDLLTAPTSQDSAAHNAVEMPLDQFLSDQFLSDQFPLDQIPLDLLGRRLLITAGATREPLDPVRFLSNRSSGKMGYALARAAAQRGADVVLVTGFGTAPLPEHPHIKIVRVQTASEMLKACQQYFPSSNTFIAAAAVADYAPERVEKHKIKKSVAPDRSRPSDSTSTSDSLNPLDEDPMGMTLRLVRTPDVVANIAQHKRTDQLVIGFAAETENLLANASMKIRNKGLDMIVANDVLAEGAGFETDTNIVTLLWPDGRTLLLPKASKDAISHRILDCVKDQVIGSSHE